jgi:hypothetical protein
VECSLFFFERMRELLVRGMNETSQPGKMKVEKLWAEACAIQSATRATERGHGRTNPQDKVREGWSLAIDPAPYQAHSVSFSID